MTARCPAGHASDESDYCSVCGAAIPVTTAAASPPTHRGIAPHPAAAPGGCPVCGEPRASAESRFCEVCRYDFVSGTSGPPPVARAPAAASGSASASASASAPLPAPALSRWILVVQVDSSLDTDPDPAQPAPTVPERVFPIEMAEMLVGRRDDRQSIRPAVPLHDPGASRRHAKFLLNADGTVALHDLASTNGTRLNGQEVVSGSIQPLKEGDEVTLGRWTRIKLRARP
jgi:hypothetical protein